MAENPSRGNFGSRIGIILATAGSAVGLGNIWRFPYMTGQNGGAAFICIYLLCIMLLGIPCMVGEFIVGRHSATNAVRAYRNMGGRKAWAAVGFLGIVTSTIILGFYSVVAGWCLHYLMASIGNQLQGSASEVALYFSQFSSNPWKPLVCATAFILFTHYIITHGISRGIEKTSKLLMPVLLLLLVALVVASCLLPNATEGIRFLFKPDFSKVNSSNFLDALGQAFFSLSLGTACLCTYASYFKRDTRLVSSAVQIALLDTVIAILAGLVIFPAAFSVGINPDSGPSLIFITLPNVFQQAFGQVPAVGYIISIMFYALLILAALTSTISMHEIGTAFFHEELRLSRRNGAWIQTLVALLIAVPCSLSVGALPQLKLMGTDIMDFCDRLTANFFLPLGALLTSLLLGWMVERKIVRSEFTNGGNCFNWLFPSFRFALRYLCPVGILLIFAHQLGWI